MKATKKAKPDLDQMMSDLLCSAFEGGSNYWCLVKELVYPEGKTEADFTYLFELPFKGGAVKITADGEKKVYTLDRKALDRGWVAFRDECARHYADAMCDTADAITGDVFLQCCLFGEIIFG